MQHTPGPWTATFGSTRTHPYNIVTQHVDYDGFDLAKCVHASDAQLIAAAPELLQSLKRCAALLARYPQHDDAWAQARAAIERATHGENHA